jgi:hypothetical protein
MEQMSEVSKAIQMFKGGYACSQAILDTYGTPLGLPHELAMQLAAGFAGGMRAGETCGAVTGAFMVLGYVIVQPAVGLVQIARMYTLVSLTLPIDSRNATDFWHVATCLTVTSARTKA